MTDNLRSKLIRLAHSKPELRPQLLPLLASQSKRASILSDGMYTDLSDSLYDVEKEIKGMKSKTKNPKAKEKMDAALKALKAVDGILEELLDME